MVEYLKYQSFKRANSKISTPLCSTRALIQACGILGNNSFQRVLASRKTAERLTSLCRLVEYPYLVNTAFEGVFTCRQYILSEWKRSRVALTLFASVLRQLTL
ncbi:hypothetical protein O6H91_05G055800 [Diphasiastrum complanatum]|uniref:Uncharacterized protein n=1 Tax=Diphasiastrum complanatum TaxID=34168 RepID=A0ACC2DNX2_DIPCM|nr:hypothetical protein O6H91_05G055800 [Diphasiastrum complanatum]